MAARKLRPFHTDEIRAKIQASQLINRLHAHALGEIELTQTQIAAIKILLGKSVPDLQAISIEGAMDVTAKVTGLAFKPRAGTS